MTELGQGTAVVAVEGRDGAVDEGLDEPVLRSVCGMSEASEFVASGGEAALEVGYGDPG